TVVREIHAHDAYRFEPERWRAFATPTLLLLGSDSPSFFAAATELLCATLPRSTRRLLPGQQHVAMETAPTLFPDEVLRYVGEQRSPAICRDIRHDDAVVAPLFEELDARVRRVHHDVVDLHFDLLLDLYERRVNKHEGIGVLGREFWPKLRDGGIGLV